jgi:hypothetical protein
MDYNKLNKSIQLACDLEKQGLRCDYDEKLNILFVSYLNFIEIAGITLSKSKYWQVYFYDCFTDIAYYEERTNWSVIKLLRKLLIDAK